MSGETTAGTLQPTGDAPAVRQPGLMDTLPLFLMFIGIFYFLVWRPQSKARQVHQKFVSGLKRGDEVCTDGGFIAKVHSVDEDRVVIDLGGSKATILKGSVRSLASARQEQERN